MHATRDAVFDAPAIHSDIVTRLPQGSIVTAHNAMSEVQAAEIRPAVACSGACSTTPNMGCTISLP